MQQVKGKIVTIGEGKEKESDEGKKQGNKKEENEGYNKKIYNIN